MAQLLELRDSQLPSERVFIDLETQEQVMLTAKKAEASLFLRIEDYYTDSSFSVGELEDLEQELKAVREKTGQKLRKTVDQIINLVRVAKSKSASIDIVAD